MRSGSRYRSARSDVFRRGGGVDSRRVRPPRMPPEVPRAGEPPPFLPPRALKEATRSACAPTESARPVSNRWDGNGPGVDPTNGLQPASGATRRGGHSLRRFALRRLFQFFGTLPLFYKEKSPSPPPSSARALEPTCSTTPLRRESTTPQGPSNRLSGRVTQYHPHDAGWDGLPQHGAKSDYLPAPTALPPRNPHCSY